MALHFAPTCLEAEWRCTSRQRARPLRSARGKMTAHLSSRAFRAAPSRIGHIKRTPAVGYCRFRLAHPVARTLAAAEAAP